MGEKRQTWKIAWRNFKTPIYFQTYSFIIWVSLSLEMKLFLGRFWPCWYWNVPKEQASDYRESFTVSHHCQLDEKSSLEGVASTFDVWWHLMMMWPPYKMILQWILAKCELYQRPHGSTQILIDFVCDQRKRTFFIKKTKWKNS